MKKFSLILEELQEILKYDDSMLDLQYDLTEMIEETTNSDDVELQKELINSFINDIDTNIIGLVNDSDIFDFYLKHRNNIDLILSDLGHFNNSPESMGVVNGVYDYIVISTKMGVQEVFKKMIEIE